LCLILLPVIRFLLSFFCEYHNFLYMDLYNICASSTTL